MSYDEAPGLGAGAKLLLKHEARLRAKGRVLCQGAFELVWVCGPHSTPPLRQRGDTRWGQRRGKGPDSTFPVRSGSLSWACRIRQ
jgi:hypothetical protein